MIVALLGLFSYLFLFLVKSLISQLFRIGNDLIYILNYKLICLSDSLTIILRIADDECDNLHYRLHAFVPRMTNVASFGQTNDVLFTSGKSFVIGFLPVTIQYLTGYEKWTSPGDNIASLSIKPTLT